MEQMMWRKRFSQGISYVHTFTVCVWYVVLSEHALAEIQDDERIPGIPISSIENVSTRILRPKFKREIVFRVVPIGDQPPISSYLGRREAYWIRCRVFFLSYPGRIFRNERQPFRRGDARADRPGRGDRVVGEDIHNSSHWHSVQQQCYIGLLTKPIRLLSKHFQG